MHSRLGQLDQTAPALAIPLRPGAPRCIHRSRRPGPANMRSQAVDPPYPGPANEAPGWPNKGVEGGLHIPAPTTGEV